MTIFWTIFAGFMTFVLGQIFVRLVIEPVHEFKKTIADIALAIINHAHIYCNPGTHGKEIEDDVSKDLRKLSSRLNAQLYLVPKYDWTKRLFGLPSKMNVSQAMRNLIGLSNSVYKPELGMKNAIKSDDICDLLGIFMSEEDRASRKVNSKL